MPRLLMYKHTRKGRKARRTKRRTQYKKTGFRTKVKKALMDLSETKSIGRVKDDRITLGNTNASWEQFHNVFPDNADLNLRLPEGYGVNERIGQRITLRGIRIPMYICNQTPEPLRVRIIIYKENKVIQGNVPPFINPLGNAEPFNYTHPWQADYAINKEMGTIVKQRTFTLSGSMDWGSVAPLHQRPMQFTGNTGIKKVEMGFSFRNKKHFFDQIGDEFLNIDQYNQLTFVWRLYGNDVPYLANHLDEGLGNLRIRQFHKVYFKDV